MLPTTSTLPISDEALHEAIAHYRAHGWARLGQVLDDAELSRLRERADAIMLGQITHEGMFFQTDAETGNYDDLPRGKGYFQGPSLKYRKIEKLERDPIFRGLIECALYGRIAHTVIGPDISLSRAVLFTKAATGGTHLPWHQDGGTFWGLSRDPVLQIWTALDDAPEESGCVELVPQSHLHGLATPLGGVIPDEVVARNPLVPAKLRVP
ncbi:MAG: phytanoyl-CoA dioxygenase family protein, partial [Deltaproteobacteria bacterium]|nr:phytanoyl-CoA dioxygenase family protein [Deltaproteobacteria bacterium]